MQICVQSQRTGAAVSGLRLSVRAVLCFRGRAFIDKVICGLKETETRRFAMPKELFGVPVGIEDTESHTIVAVVIFDGDSLRCESVEQWDQLRNEHQVPVGNGHDMTRDGRSSKL